MLTKRTNVLFEERIYQYLAGLAQNRGVSVGELIRKAVGKVYLEQEERVKQKRMEAFKKILVLQEDTKIPKKINYRELIEDGRRY